MGITSLIKISIITQHSIRLRMLMKTEYHFNMNVLSLFDGMSTGQQALHDLGVPVNLYYASEIKNIAIKLSTHHFPNTIHLGDVNDWKSWDIDWAGIDMVFSGSPCQDLSLAGSRAGINGSKSNLFFTFVEILNHIRKLNPQVYFLQENVASATKMDVGIMSRSLGVYPVMIDSKLVTAQRRKRYYWTNIKTKQTLFDVVTDIPQPKDLNISFQSVVTSGTVSKFKSGALLEKNARACRFTDMKSDKAQKYLFSRGMIYSFANVVTEPDHIRLTNQIEEERLQGFKDGYTSILDYYQASSLLGDGWTLPIIKHILSHLRF